MLKSVFIHCLGVLVLLSAGKQLGQNRKQRKTIAVQTINSRDKKEIAFAKKLVHCFKTANVKEWLALFPTDKECHDLLMQMAAAGEPGFDAAPIDEWAAQRKKEAVGHYTTIMVCAAGKMVFRQAWLTMMKIEINVDDLYVV